MASTRAQILTVLQRYSQREAAQRIGVSERTIRRWKNEGVEPVNEFIALSLRDEFGTVKRAIKRRNLRETRGYEPIETEVPLLAERQLLQQRDKFGELTGERYDSDWVNYNVSRLDNKDILDALKLLRDRGETVQIIYRIPPGGTSPGGRTFPKGGRGSTGAEDLTGRTDFELWHDLLAPIVQRNLRVKWIGVID
jgi:transcriptional regulator with XRE-family HTH domain